jgi:hypothetical protein
MGAKVGILTIGFPGPIPHGCQMVSMTGKGVVGSWESDDLYVQLFTGYINE